MNLNQIYIWHGLSETPMRYNNGLLIGTYRIGHARKGVGNSSELPPTGDLFCLVLKFKKSYA